MRISDWSSDVCSSDLRASDVDHAARSAAGIFVAYILLCGLWLATGWHKGPTAVLMGTVAVAFFGGGDEPGTAIAAFGRFAFLSLFLSPFLRYEERRVGNECVITRRFRRCSDHVKYISRLQICVIYNK